MTLNSIIESSIHAVVLEEKKKKRNLIHSPFNQRACYSSLTKETDKDAVADFQLEIEKSKTSKAFTSDIVDRQFQRRNAFSELCDAERRLIVQIVTDLKRESYMQQLCD